MANMFELSPLAARLGFDFQVVDASHAMVRHHDWSRGFSNTEECRRFFYAVEAGAKLTPADCVSPFDAMATPEYHDEQYNEGRKLADEGAVIYISITGCWSADVRPVLSGQTGWGHLAAYERLGYHSCTSDLLRGWQDGGAVIVDYRAVQNMY
jgi:hypothetical protein